MDDLYRSIRTPLNNIQPQRLAHLRQTMGENSEDMVVKEGGVASRAQRRVLPARRLAHPHKKWVIIYLITD